MIRMRMINPDDIPGTVSNSRSTRKHVERIHIVTVSGPFLVQIFALAEACTVWFLSLSVVPIIKPQHSFG